MDINALISQLKQNGESDEMIMVRLQQQGYAPDQIKAGIDMYYQHNSTSIQVKPDNFKRILIIVGALSIFLTVAIFFVVKTFYLNSQSQDADAKFNESTTSRPSQQNLQTETNTPDAKKHSTNNIIVYVTTSEQEDTLHFFDSTTKSEITSFQKPSLKEGVTLLSTWSPEGTYLPILFLQTVGTRDSTLYLYNHASKKIASIYTATDAEAEVGLRDTAFPYSSGWIDNEKFYFSKDLRGDKNIMKYITTSGVMGSEERGNVTGFFNNRLKYTYEVLGTSIKSTLEVDGKVLPIAEGTSIFAMRKDLIYGLQLEQENVLEKTEAFMKANEERFKSMSEQDQQKEIQAFMSKPSGASIQIIDAKTGAISKTINLADENWQVVSAQLHPTKETLVIHQNNGLFLSTEDRFLLIDITTGETREWFIQKRDAGEDRNAFNLLQFGKSFFVTDNGEWLVLYRQIPNTNPEAVSIIMKNFNTNEEFTVCNENCDEFRVYNSSYLQPIY